LTREEDKGCREEEEQRICEIIFKNQLKEKRERRRYNKGLIKHFHIIE